MPLPSAASGTGDASTNVAPGSPSPAAKADDANPGMTVVQAPELIGGPSGQPQRAVFPPKGEDALGGKNEKGQVADRSTPGEFASGGQIVASGQTAVQSTAGVTLLTPDPSAQTAVETTINTPATSTTPTHATPQRRSWSHIIFTVDFDVMSYLSSGFWGFFSVTSSLIRPSTYTRIPPVIGLSIVTFAVGMALVHGYYWFSSSSCLWRHASENVYELEILRIGAMVNSSQGATIAQDLMSLKPAVDELRLMARSRFPRVGTGLDDALYNYSDSLSAISRRHMRVDAGVWALAATAMANDDVIYKHLERSSYTPWWLRSFCYGPCRAPNHSVKFSAFSQLKEALTGVLDATLHDATTLADEARHTLELTSALRRQMKALGVAKDVAPETDGEVFSQLWDHLLPYLSLPSTVKAERRKLLSGAHALQQKSFDRLAKSHNDLRHIKVEMNWLDLFSDSTSTWGRTRHTCTPRSHEGMRAFKPLEAAALELRALLASYMTHTKARAPQQ